MKKFKTLLLTSLTAVVLCFCFLFAGCGSVAGTYKFDSMTVAGQTVEAGEGLLTEDYMVVTLNEDGTATYSVMGNEALDCKWEEVDGKIVLKAGEMEVASFEHKGSKLVAEEGDNKLTLKK